MGSVKIPTPQVTKTQTNKMGCKVCYSFCTWTIKNKEEKQGKVNTVEILKIIIEYRRCAVI